MVASHWSDEAAEHERQFREMLEFCPAALLVVDEDGRLLFHNARLRELLGYGKDELDRVDTRKFWHDLEQRSRIIASLRERGGQILNEKVVWRTKNGQLLDLLLTYAQVAYRGGHISFVGGKRVLWVYDITALTRHELQVVEQERQLREILDYCPAAVCVVDDEGRILFHNRRMRDLLGYEKEELQSIRHQVVLARPRPSNAHHRSAANPRRAIAERGSDFQDQAR